MCIIHKEVPICNPPNCQQITVWTNCQTTYVKLYRHLLASRLTCTYLAKHWKWERLFLGWRQTCMSSSESRAHDGRSSLGNICTFALVCLCISDNDPSLPSKQAISLEGTSSLVVIMLSLSGPRSTIWVWMCSSASWAGKSSWSGPYIKSTHKTI